MKDDRQEQKIKDDYASYYPITVKKHPTYGYGYGLALARSLILYADHDTYFKKIFLLILLQLGYPTHSAEPSRGPYRPTKQDELFILSDQKEAMQRMEWIIERTESGELPDKYAIERSLSYWVREYAKEDPKAVVIGLVVGVVPPVGLGHLTRKKKMSLIVEHAIGGKPELMASCAVEASLGVIREALMRANGNTKKFEPEIADWFFGDRAVGVYGADEPTLRAIKLELAELSAVYHVLEDGEHMTAIAISPVVNGLIQEIHWDIEPL